MPSVQISPKAFNYLKSLAEPFVDTPESVVDRIIDEHARRNGAAAPSKPSAPPIYRLERLPDLHFTRIERIELDGRVISTRSWNGLVEEVIRTCVSKGFDREEVRRKISANTRIGAHQDNGFRYIREANFSVQGQDADRACSIALQVSKAFGIPLTIDFAWRETEKALHPGRSARVTNE